ncbi:MAG: VanZ family protein [Myxococcales bacterium]|nr:VanZ family protein [Myxococcales bacterium]
MVIFCLSHQRVSSDFVAPFPHADKVVHAVVYGGFCWLLSSAWGGGWCPKGQTFRFHTYRRSFGLPVLWVSFYGITDEIHQAFVPGRTADVWDWVADTVGALVCACLFAVFLPKRSSL